MLLYTYTGEVAEWSKALVWSTSVRVKPHRGFESLPLRSIAHRCSISVDPQVPDISSLRVVSRRNAKLALRLKQLQFRSG